MIDLTQIPDVYRPQHFQLKELVSRAMWERRGEKCIELFDPRLLITLDQLREDLGRPITVNNWCFGGNLEQRGLRDEGYYIEEALKDGYTTADGLADYAESLSQHKYGRAVDFNVKGMTAAEVRAHIHKNKHKYPFITFIETDISWCHIDVRGGNYRIWSPSRGFVSQP
ncbi:hypothetical protein [Vibrio alginolyticus]|uniref:hypothetical protein n=1 Tax=Vibrio alginolyticus TaxID=663 RepID=UPI0035C6F320